MSGPNACNTSFLCQADAALAGPCQGLGLADGTYILSIALQCAAVCTGAAHRRKIHPAAGRSCLSLAKTA